MNIVYIKLKEFEDMTPKIQALVDAIRASVAIPTIFTPKQIDEHYLIDGGVLNPFPIAPKKSI